MNELNFITRQFVAQLSHRARLGVVFRNANRRKAA